MTPTANSAHRFDWLAGVATALAIATCYGTLVLISALSLLGITLAAHEGAWAGAVSLLALLAAVGVLLGYHQHRALAPLTLALAGAALILWVMFGRYDRIMEIAGFAALAVAAVWDWRLKAQTHKQENGYAGIHP